MTPFERPTYRIAVRAGIIAFAAMMVLALASVSARRAGPVPGEINDPAQTSAGADAKAATRSAKEVRGATPYIELKNEPPPKLIVDPPLPDLLAQGVVWIQWRAENVHILPVFGKGALSASPRIGHLHVHVDDLPWWWADPSNVNTLDLAGMPPGPHKIRIELVNANHEVFPGQSKTVTFNVGKGASHPHAQ
jgi:Family of unknown function (DUF6130)